MKVYNSIIDILKKNNCSYKTFVHEPVLTSEQAARVRGNDLSMGAKAMVLRSQGKYFMAVVSGAKTIDMKKLKKILKTKSLSFASPEEVLKITGCEPGGVPPFGNLFNIPIFLDSFITKHETIDFNAGLRTHSIEMMLKDYVEIVKPMIAEFSK